MYATLGLRVEDGGGGVVPDPPARGVRPRTLVAPHPVDEDPTRTAHGPDQDVGPGLGEDGAAVAGKVELGVVGEHGPVFGQARLGDAGDGEGVVPAQLGEEVAPAAQVALGLHGALLGVDLGDGVGQQQAAVVPVAVEDDVPRLHVRGQVVVRRHAVDHEGEVGAVPVGVDVERRPDGGFERRRRRAPRRERLQVGHAPEHEHLDGDGLLQDLRGLLEAARPSRRGGEAEGVAVRAGGREGQQVRVPQGRRRGVVTVLGRGKGGVGRLFRLAFAQGQLVEALADHGAVFVGDDERTASDGRRGRVAHYAQPEENVERLLVLESQLGYWVGVILRG